MRKTKQQISAENEALKSILRKVYEECYYIGVYGRKNRIKKKNIVDTARATYCEILEKKENLGL